MTKYENDHELKQFVQSIVEKEISERIQYNIIESKDQEMKKNSLLNGIIFSIQQTIEQGTEQIEEKYDKEIQDLKKNIQELREKIVQQHQQSPMKRHSSFIQVNQDGITNSDRKVKDLEDNIKIKYLKMENIINILMENQLLMKNQIAEIRSEENNNTSISSEEIQIEQKIDTKCNEFKRQIEEISSEIKQTIQGKMLFYWKVLDDQISQIETLRSDVELIYSDPKNYYKRRISKQYLTTQ